MTVYGIADASGLLNPSSHAEEIVNKKGLAQITDSSAIENLVDEVLQLNSVKQLSSADTICVTVQMGVFQQQLMCVITTYQLEICSMRWGCRLFG